MKLVIDEKLKHRLIGLMVILSLGAIFLPAMMKKSSQRLENNFSVNVQLPPKPQAPNVVMTDEKEMFQTIKVADIKSPSPMKSKSSELDKKDFIQSVQVSNDAGHVVKTEAAPDTKVITKPIELALTNAVKNSVKKQINVPARKPVLSASKINSPDRRPNPVIIQANNNRSLNKMDIYAVQLASFAKLSNAQALVNKLRSKGYKANYIKTTSQQRIIYKVYAGHSPVKRDVLKLRTQLASAMQLNGFVVNTGVS